MERLILALALYLSPYFGEMPPTISDCRRFPDHESAVEAERFARELRRAVVAEHGVEERSERAMALYLIDLDFALNAYDLLERASNEKCNEGYRLEHLRLLRRCLGPEAYRLGVMPLPPTWLLRDITDVPRRRPFVGPPKPPPELEETP